MTNNTITKEPQDMLLDHISVCICTYKRAEMLARALDGVISQVTDSDFTLEVVIVDNDKERSAQELVHKYQKSGNCRITYDCEPEKSIPLARNRAIQKASGNLIAFIDDDEFPAENWLCKMYLCLKEYNADGVLGPVLPHFPFGAPKWLAKSGLCKRPRNATGSPTTFNDLRTGNALFQRYVFEKDEIWFDPALGLTGGSDGRFLSKQVERGRKFVWCDEALVFETVSEERWPAKYYLKRNFRIGTLAGKRYRHTRNPNAVLTSFLILSGNSLILPFSFIAGKHIWVKILTKIYYQAGCLLSFLNLKHVPHKQ
jgi:glycosyltransferase involved in cell wall biosynthesis